MSTPENQVITAGERMAKRDAPLTPMAIDANATPLQMLAIAVQQGADIDKLEKLMALARDWETNEARKAYVRAMSSFKAEPHTIFKTKYVDIPGGAKFHHATLADVVDGVVASLAKFGLSHNWITEQVDRMIKVTCVITHELGHSERTEMSGAPDDSGKKNPIQQVGSTVTFLQRYTLMSLCGLAAKDMDDETKMNGGKPREAEPEGYDNWTLDMEALADEGLERLTAAWGKASPEFRRYVVKFDEKWWLDQKAKAGKVKS